MTISGSVLTLLLMVLRYTVLRKMPSTVYYYAWLLVLLRLALPLPGLIPTMAETAAATPVSEVPAVYSVNSENYGNSGNYASENAGHAYVIENNDAKISDTAESDVVRSEEITNEEKTQEVLVSEVAPKPALSAISIDWKSPAIWLTVWALGAIASMGITVFSYLHFSFKLKKRLIEPDSFTKAVYASIPGRKPALYLSDSARTPMLLGVIKPMIVLPLREYNEELLLNILRHELTHYRRHDTLYKWMATAVLSLHWFNPLAWIIRREINRSCELSCDEMLLRSMNKDEKQSYGNSLLLMAVSSPLPQAVVATSFATEKRNLKERLVQIMNYKKSGARVLASILAIALLTGCGIAAGPVSETTSDKDSEITHETTDDKPAADGGAVRVETVDEFLAAIAPDTVIELAEGVFDLSTASNYGEDSESDYYTWNLEGMNDASDVDAELIIHDVDNLTIRGAGMDETTIAAVPRYANVIDFKYCENITVSNLTAGHTKEPGLCSGGVFRVENCSDFNVDTCGLYGCGTIGVYATSCEKLNVTDCDIYECSNGAVLLGDCDEVLVSGCDIHDIGLKDDVSAYCIFAADYGTGISFYNNKIHDSKAEGLLYTSETESVVFLSNEVTNNRFTQSAFHFDIIGATVDGCKFEDNSGVWYMDNAYVKAVDVDGNYIEADQFESMELRDIKPDTVVPSNEPVPTLAARDVPAGSEVEVTTIDEFLDAIGPDRTIVLDGENFNMTEAGNYGGIGTEYYSWEEIYDGPQLVIHDVSNLTIKAKDTDPAATTLETLPRYANVLVFRNCDNVTVAGFTAGHTKDMGACSGGVIYLDNCENMTVEDMRLYGCGVTGVDTYMSSEINVINTEIYECSYGAAYLAVTSGIHFTDCNIHDVPSPALVFSDCTDITWNGEELKGTYLQYNVEADGTLVVYDET